MCVCMPHIYPPPRFQRAGVLGSSVCLVPLPGPSAWSLFLGCGVLGAWPVVNGNLLGATTPTGHSSRMSRMSRMTSRDFGRVDKCVFRIGGVVKVEVWVGSVSWFLQPLMRIRYISPDVATGGFHGPPRSASETHMFIA